MVLFHIPNVKNKVGVKGTASECTFTISEVPDSTRRKLEYFMFALFRTFNTDNPNFPLTFLLLNL